MKKKLSLFMGIMVSLSICFTGCGEEKKESTFQNVKESKEEPETKPSLEVTSDTPQATIEPTTESEPEPTEELADEDFVVPIKNFVDGYYGDDGSVCLSAFPREAVENYLKSEINYTYDEFVELMTEELQNDSLEMVDYTFTNAEELDEDTLTCYENYISTLMENPSVTKGYSVEMSVAGSFDNMNVYLINGEWSCDFTVITEEDITKYADGVPDEEITLEIMLNESGELKTTQDAMDEYVENNPQFSDGTFEVEGNCFIYSYYLADGYTVDPDKMDADLNKTGPELVDSMEIYYGIRPTIIFNYYASDGSLLKTGTFD